MVPAAAADGIFRAALLSKSLSFRALRERDQGGDPRPQRPVPQLRVPAPRPTGFFAPLYYQSPYHFVHFEGGIKGGTHGRGRAVVDKGPSTDRRPTVLADKWPSTDRRPTVLADIWPPGLTIPRVLRYFCSAPSSAPDPQELPPKIAKNPGLQKVSFSC